MNFVFYGDSFLFTNTSIQIFPFQQSDNIMNFSITMSLSSIAQELFQDYAFQTHQRCQCIHVDLFINKCQGSSHFKEDSAYQAKLNQSAHDAGRRRSSQVVNVFVHLVGRGYEGRFLVIGASQRMGGVFVHPFPRPLLLLVRVVVGDVAAVHEDDAHDHAHDRHDDGHGHYQTHA